MMHIRVLGTPSFGPGAKRLATKHEVLLVLLAGELRPLSRQGVAELLWSSAGSASARHSVSQALYSIRRRNPGLITSSAKEISIAPQVKADARLFCQAVSEGRFKEAAALYSGPFAFGKDYGLTDALADRIQRLRWTYHEKARSVCFALRDSLDLRQCAAVAHQLIALDPLDEEVLQAQIEALVGLGDVAAAEYRWRKASDLWLSEFKRDWPHPKPVSRAVLGVKPRKEHDGCSSAFVGRRSEIDQLIALWKSKKTGFDCIVVTGEAGIGKTALADRFRRLLALRGVATVWATAHPLERALPLGVVAQWLEPLSGEGPGMAARLRSPTADTHVRDFTQSSDLEGAIIGRQRLYEELSHELTSTSKPTCMFIDDVHWADDASLGFVGYVRHYGLGPRAMLVVTTRSDTERGALDILEGVDQLELPPLDLGDIVELYRSRAGPGSEVVTAARKLLERTGGNPLLLSAFLAEGLDAVSELTTIPSSIGAYLESRLARLSASARLVMAALGVSQRTSIDALRFITQLEPELHKSVAELSEAGFVQFTTEYVRPRHGMMAEVAVRMLGPAFERQLRARAARLLQVDAASPAAVAVQYDLAGHRERAFEASLRAADAALELFAFREAEHFFRIALANAPDDEGRALVKCRTADMHAWQCQYAAALEIIDSCSQLDISSESRRVVNAHCTIVRLLGNQDAEVLKHAKALFTKEADSLSLELRARLALAWRFAAHAKGQPSDVLEAAGWTSRIADELPAGKLKLKMQLSAQAIHAMYISAKEAVNRTFTLVTEAAEWPDLLATAYATLGSTRIAAGQSEAAEKDLLTALEIVESTGNNEPLFMIANNLGVLFQEEGRFEEAVAMFDRALENRLQGVVPAWAQLTLDNLVTLEYERGAWEDAIRRADQLLSQSEQRTISGRSWCCHHSIKGLSYLKMGKRAAARDSLRKIEEGDYSSSYSSNDVSYVEIFLARMAELSGNTEHAVARLQAKICEYAPRDFFCAARMRVENLRIQLNHFPCAEVEEAAALRTELTGARARPLVDSLDSILTRAGKSIS